MVRHYELLGDHFAKTTGYEYYADIVATQLRAEGADGLSDFFMELQVYGTPQQGYDRVKYIYEQSQCCASVDAFKFGGMPYDDARASMRLFAKEVMAELRKFGADILFATEPATPPAFMAA